jgi:hypothetical protein
MFYEDRIRLGVTVLLAGHVLACQDIGVLAQNPQEVAKCMVASAFPDGKQTDFGTVLTYEEKSVASLCSRRTCTAA